MNYLYTLYLQDFVPNLHVFFQLINFFSLQKSSEQKFAELKDDFFKANKGRLKTIL